MEKRHFSLSHVRHYNYLKNSRMLHSNSISFITTLNKYSNVFTINKRGRRRTSYIL